jgi:hypothetical protein
MAGLPGNDSQIAGNDGEDQRPVSWPVCSRSVLFSFSSAKLR